MNHPPSRPGNRRLPSEVEGPGRSRDGALARGQSGPALGYSLGARAAVVRATEPTDAHARGRHAPRGSALATAVVALTIVGAAVLVTPLGAEARTAQRRRATSPSSATTTERIDAMERWRRDFAGIRTTERQVDASGTLDASRRQRLLIRLVTPLDAAPGLYFYIERARLDRLPHPLLQEVWKASPQGNRVIVERFRLKAPGRFLGARSSDALLQRLSAQDMEVVKGCDLRFVDQDGRWEGTIEGPQCPSIEGGSTPHRTTLAWTASTIVLDERIVEGQSRAPAAADQDAPYEFFTEQPLEATR